MESASIGRSLFLQYAEFDEVNLNGSRIEGQLITIGSTFKGKLTMGGVAIERSLFLRDAIFDDVVLIGSEVGGQLSARGSTFNGKLNMDSISTGQNVVLRDAMFNDVVLKSSNIGGRFDATGSTFNRKLDMDSVSIDGDVFLRNAVFDDVDLSSSNIGGHFSADGSTFNGKLDMDSVSIGRSLYLHNAVFDHVVLNGTRLGGQLSTIGSKFNGKLDMEAVSIRDNLFLAIAVFDEVNLNSSKIGGHFHVGGSTFKGQLGMEFVSIGGDLVLQSAVFQNAVGLSFANVGSSLDARGAELRKLDLRGARIERELRLGSSSGNVKWCTDEHCYPVLDLRNTTVGVLQDSEAAWPENLDRKLEGFTYARLGGFGANENEMPFTRGSGWYIEWLEGDKTYSPQPYRHLADILDAAGHGDMAGDILFASRERERTEESKPWQSRWWFLSALRFTIGYGYGWGHFWALAWVAGIAAFGTAVLRWAGERDKDGKHLGFSYSLDMLLPAIHLREQHYEVDLATWAKYYFYAHKIAGYVLAFFVIAGLTNLGD